MPPRGPTAYFLFAGEVRESVQAEIAAENDGKANVAAVGKAIGLRWQQLSDEEKQRYKDLAAQKAAELKEQQPAREDGDDADGGEVEATGSAPPPPPPFGFPTSLIKKIACMDPEVDRMGADAVRALSKATALFIESLAAKSLAHAQQSKRKNFKFADIEAVAKRDRRLNDMGLADFFKNDRAFEGVHAARQDAENEGKAGGRGRPKKDGAAQEEEAQKAMRPLTDFFAVGSGSRGGGGVDEDAGQEEL